MQASLFSFFWWLGTALLRQPCRQKIISFHCFPSISTLPHTTQICVTQMVKEDLNYQPIINPFYPRWRPICKSTSSWGLHDGEPVFWHFCRGSKLAPLPTAPLLPVDFKKCFFASLRWNSDCDSLCWFPIPTFTIFFLIKCQTHEWGEPFRASCLM